MENVTKLSFADRIKAYFQLAKPGIIFGNAITATAGFLLASKGQIDFWLFLAMLEGLSLIIGSACVFNNYIDRDLDKKMARTKKRPLAKEVLSEKSAVFFGLILFLSGVFILLEFTNPLTLLASLLGFCIYLFLYSLLKYRTVHATIIGSLAGAMPPVVGYTAVSNQFDLAALILFLMIALWQMPHFLAIAIYRLDDYLAGSIPILPLTKGVLRTKFQIILYVLAFLIASSFLSFFNYLGPFFFAAAFILNLLWLVFGIKGLKTKNDQSWARKMFIASLVIVTALSILIPFNLR